ncbi:putative PEP-binding protein [Methanobacterium ferruginis]|uniref:putative PEP-binding protein n=1 Tax=Methanobacterium ferruginis TaxID=710191 RepID=UPI002572744F|nr:putative PEP-binding protein [Methanobacterium ferruginis]BDZ68303.1 phosphoenolpyruvate synthase [Methanobacterium ferruginis]
MIILRGIGTGSYVGVGRVKKIEKDEDLLTLKGGEVVVLSRASRDMLTHLHRASGVVTDYGGLTSHVAIVLREMKVPCVVGTGEGTKKLKEGIIVTVDGRTGNIYQGFIERDNKADFQEFYYPATNIKVNLNVPEIAYKVAPYADGVGSIRIENSIIRTGKHPHVLLLEGKLSNVIADSVRQIADAFHPKPVWFRTFDIPTDELKRLKGGNIEPDEANPLLGLRGIHKDLKTPKILEAEFEALLKLIDDGYDNLGVKIPFLRDVSEYKETKKIMCEVGLRPHRDLPVGASIETPSSVFSLDEFIDEGVDFVTLGMSDMAMSSLAVDRRGVKVAKLFNLTHPSVLRMMEMVIEKCNQNDIESCICGHAGSDPAIVRWLVGKGISSISTNPDQILRIRKVVDVAEKTIIRKGFGSNF